jgi:hypothetical protein
MSPEPVTAAAETRRKLRWAKEKAAAKEYAAHQAMMAEIARWKKVAVSDLILSINSCGRAPADLACVYVESSDPYRNPCVFCGHFERDIF